MHLLCLGEGGLAEAAKSRGVPVRRAAHEERLGYFRAPSPAPGSGRGAVVGCGRPGPPGYAAAWDVVHTHGMRANLPVRLAMSRGRRRPCLFTTVHSDLLLDYASPALARTYQALDLATIRLVDTIVCVSDGLRTLLVERGYPRDRMVRIRSGIEGSPAFGEVAREAVSAVERVRRCARVRGAEAAHRYGRQTGAGQGHGPASGGGGPAAPNLPRVGVPHRRRRSRAPRAGGRDARSRV